MSAASPWSRSRHDFALGSVPRTDDEARTFLQERLALFCKWCCVLVPLAMLLYGSVHARSLANVRLWVVHQGGWVYLALSLLCALLWNVYRSPRVRLSLPVLNLCDLVLTVLSVSCASLGLLLDPHALIHQATAAFVNILFFRTVLIPTTVRWTVVVGLAATLPMLACLHAAPFQALSPGSPEDAWVGFGGMGIMCIFGIVLSAVGAHVLYGLRETARHALQLGQYTLLDKIGEGGMGVVYLAQHALLRRPTAVKLLPPGRASPNDVERFEREVQLTSLLTHPNTVAIYDYGRTPDGVFYYAMEYLDGFSLDELVRLTGPQPPGRIIHILRQALRALAEAHGLGIIHRDIKPANILLCERGGVYDFVKVVDFGLVKELESESDARGNATEITAIIGTPHYISPEAIRSPSELDPRSDLYALGAVGYFLLTGKPPFDGNTLIEIYSHHLHTNVAWPARPVPESPSDDLEAVLRACLAKAQKDRPRDAATCLALLDQCRNAHAWGPREAHAWWMEHGALRRRRQLNPDPEAQTLPMASRTFSPQRKAS